MALPCHLIKRSQWSQCTAPISTYLLKSCKCRVPRSGQLSFSDQPCPHHVPALLEQSFGLVELIPFTQEITQAEVVARTVDQRLQSNRLRHDLSGLTIRRSRLSQPSLPPLKLGRGDETH